MLMETLETPDYSHVGHALSLYTIITSNGYNKFYFKALFVNNLHHVKYPQLKGIESPHSKSFSDQDTTPH
jgi:hypothetical protein